MDSDLPVAAEAKPPAGQRRREKRDVHGWVVLDKPVGMTSTHAVSVVKRVFKARRAGHAGTLDPLASGVLPIALGEATKTVPFVMDGRKRYRFTVRWGEERDTDDAEGRVTATSARASERRGDPRAPAALHRHDRAGAAALFRGQDRRRARLRSRARGRSRRTRGPSRWRFTASNSSRMPDRRRRSRRVRGRMRQGHLCAGARPRHGTLARLLRSCRGAAPDSGRAVRRDATA